VSWRSKIDGYVDAVLPDIVEIRHTIHGNPELALHEVDTSALVRTTLEPTDLLLSAPLLDTDVIGILEGRATGKNVTLRADMDALPLQELDDHPYRSARNGYMHACGHDGHTAMLIGAALVLNKLRAHFDGTVRFVFQPGEEVVAAGKHLLEKGALLDPEPDAVFALHAWPLIAKGAIASKPGVLMAAADFFKVTIAGKGGHGSRPEDTVDPILVASRVVQALHTIPSRDVSALRPVVCSVCKISGGTNGNIIPDSVEMEGTTRYLDGGTGTKVHRRIEQIIAGVCDSAGASFELEYVQPYVPTVNDPDAVALGKRTALDVLGTSSWVQLDEPSMGGEDFSYYIRDYPGAMFQLGMGEQSAPLHNAHFDFCDEALRNGILFLVAVTLNVLTSPPKAA